MNEIIGISKYKNIGGVTCYMNSILAILQQIDIFCDFVISSEFVKFLNKKLKTTESIPKTIIYQIHKLFKISLSMDDGSLTPTSLRKVCADKDFIWGNSEQQDSSEFLQFVLNQLFEEMGQDVLLVPGKFKDIPSLQDEPLSKSFLSIQSIISLNQFLRKEFSPITNLFTSLQHTTIRCKICKNENNSFETSNIWQLHIPFDQKNPNQEFDIYELMDKWSEDEKLDDKNRYRCEFCGGKSNATKNIKMMRTPKILILQLLRFKKDMYGQIHRKIVNKVKYPVCDLDISKYLTNGSNFTGKTKYNLFAVNCHFELGQMQNLNWGHYISIVKNRLDNNWYAFNDSHKPIKILSESDIIHKNSYLLFYYRTN